MNWIDYLVSGMMGRAFQHMRVLTLLLASTLSVASGPLAVADVNSGTMTCTARNHFAPQEKGIFIADWGTDSSGKNSFYPTFTFTQNGMKSQLIYGGAVDCGFDTAKLSRPVYCPFDTTIMNGPANYTRASNICGQYAPGAFQASAALQYDNSNASGFFSCVWDFVGSEKRVDIWIDLTHCH